MIGIYRGHITVVLYASVMRQFILVALDGLRFSGREPFPQGKSGQAMIEYLMAAIVLMAAIAILAVFLYTFKSYSGRVLDLAASEYP